MGTVFRTARPPTPEEEALYPYQLAEKSRALLGESGLNPANDKVVQLLRALVVPHDKVLASRARFEMQPGHDVPVLCVDNLVEQARDEVREAMAMLQREAESGGLPEGLPEVVRGKSIPKFRPDGIRVVHVGGGAGLFSAIIPGWLSGPSGSQTTPWEIQR